jgi:hypothetical protein
VAVAFPEMEYLVLLLQVQAAVAYQNQVCWEALILDLVKLLGDSAIVDRAPPSQLEPILIIHIQVQYQEIHT